MSFNNPASTMPGPQTLIPPAAPVVNQAPVFGSMPQPSNNLHPTPLINTSQDFSDDDEDDDDEGMDQEFDEDGNPVRKASSFQISINTTHQIHGNNNVVSVDPATSASNIAEHVTAAIRKLSKDDQGVPFVDELGRIRPIKLTIKAGTHVRGSGNAVGEKAVQATVSARTMPNATSTAASSLAGTEALKRRLLELKALQMERKRDSTHAGMHGEGEPSTKKVKTEL